jgi:hypothetical protein
VSDYEIPRAEPAPEDEKIWIGLQHFAERAVLRGHPYQDKEKCDNCMYYLDPSSDLSYCWHPQLRILVGADWWCQWWEEIPED